MQSPPAVRTSLADKRAASNPLVWVTLADGPLRDAPGVYVPCSGCSMAAKNAVWERRPKIVSCGDRDTPLPLQHFCFEGIPETVHMVVANPIISSEPSGTGCISEWALWQALCLSFTFNSLFLFLRVVKKGLKVLSHLSGLLKPWEVALQCNLILLLWDLSGMEVSVGVGIGQYFERNQFTHSVFIWKCILMIWVSAVPLLSCSVSMSSSVAMPRNNKLLFHWQMTLCSSDLASVTQASWLAYCNIPGVRLQAMSPGTECYGMPGHQHPHGAFPWDLLISFPVSVPWASPWGLCTHQVSCRTRKKTTNSDCDHVRQPKVTVKEELICVGNRR